jgi:hypothetical protein
MLLYTSIRSSTTLPLPPVILLPTARGSGRGGPDPDPDGFIADFLLSLDGDDVVAADCGGGDLEDVALVLVVVSAEVVVATVSTVRPAEDFFSTLDAVFSLLGDLPFDVPIVVYATR